MSVVQDWYFAYECDHALLKAQSMFAALRGRGPFVVKRASAEKSVAQSVGLSPACHLCANRGSPLIALECSTYQSTLKVCGWINRRGGATMPAQVLTQSPGTKSPRYQG
jgi:hypothetical protein